MVACDVSCWAGTTNGVRRLGGTSTAMRQVRGNGPSGPTKPSLGTTNEDNPRKTEVMRSIVCQGGLAGWPDSAAGLTIDRGRARRSLANSLSPSTPPHLRSSQTSNKPQPRPARTTQSTMPRPPTSLRALALAQSKPQPFTTRRTFAAPTSTPRPSASSPNAAFIVFDRQAKLEQRNVAASDKERSRLTDYVKDQVAGNMVDRLLVSEARPGRARVWEGRTKRRRGLDSGADRWDGDRVERQYWWSNPD